MYILAVLACFVSFSYYGTENIIVLYATQVLSFSDAKSYSLFGIYAALIFGLPVLGGIIADRFIGLRRAVVIGAVLMIVGNLILLIPMADTFKLGLVFSVCAIGFYKASTAGWIGTLYPKDDHRSEGAFTVFYVAMNIGATISPIIYGLQIYHWKWSVGFAVSALGVVISLIFLLKSKHTSEKVEQRTARHITIIFSPLILLAVVGFLFFYAEFFKEFIGALAIFLIVYLTILLWHRSKAEKFKILLLLLLFIFGMCFFAASLQVGSSISLFINRDVHRMVLGFTIPTVMFSSLYPLAVIVMSPFIRMLWTGLASIKKEPALPTKIAIALVLGGIGFLCFHWTSSHSVAGIVLGNFCLGTGELCLMPAVLTAIGHFTEHSLKATMMGIWYFFIAAGGYLSSLVAKWSSQGKVSFTVYSSSFLKIALVLLIIAGVLFLLSGWFRSRLAIHR